MNQLSQRCQEGFEVGQTFGSGRPRIDEDRVLPFVAVLDPDPFHLDEAAARRSIFRGLTASGWRWSTHMLPAMMFLLGDLSIT
jgi:acyl dehydratase